MQRAENDRLIYKILSIATLVSIPVGIALLALVAVKGDYIATGLLAAVVAHGCYGVGFYFRAYRRSVSSVSLISQLSGKDSVAVGELCEPLGLSSEGVSLIFLRAVKKGYIKGYSLDGGVISRVRAKNDGKTD